MATKVGGLFSSTLKICSNSVLRKKVSPCVIPRRTLVCKETGSLLPEPTKTPLGLIKVAVTVVPFLTLGTVLGREGASFLEESEIFVPDDDDD